MTHPYKDCFNSRFAVYCSGISSYLNPFNVWIVLSFHIFQHLLSLRFSWREIRGCLYDRQCGLYIGTTFLKGENKKMGQLTTIGYVWWWLRMPNPNWCGTIPSKQLPQYTYFVSFATHLHCSCYFTGDPNFPLTLSCQEGRTLTDKMSLNTFNKG